MLPIKRDRSRLTVMVPKGKGNGHCCAIGYEIRYRPMLTKKPSMPTIRTVWVMLFLYAIVCWSWLKQELSVRTDGVKGELHRHNAYGCIFTGSRMLLLPDWLKVMVILTESPSARLWFRFVSIICRPPGWRYSSLPASTTK